MKKSFELHADYKPSGDQPNAISSLAKGIKDGKREQVLLGVTGSGKTFTMANVIQSVNKPTLVLAHNKTLVGQLYEELRAFFPNNAVEYFVSYYDYYQPEAYVPSTDTYIEKDSQINETIDRMRHRATTSLLTRDDVIIVASVSCIYGIGSTDSYQNMTVFIEKDRSFRRESLMRQLIESQYLRNDIDFSRGTFRAKGDIIDIFPPSEENLAVRINFFGDNVERITMVDPLKGKTVRELSYVTIFPASHYATTKEKMSLALKSIRDELLNELISLKKQNKLLEAQRLEQRTLFDLEMLETVGVCKGIENYSRHLSGRLCGEPPPTLIDYFPKDFLLFVDESHQTIPQIRGMYRGDRARKETLTSHGFRLPSALDNRPLRFDEFDSIFNQAVYVSATPGNFEIERAQGEIVEQIIRPTGLLDPQVKIRPVSTQIDDVVHEAKTKAQNNERVLITTLTKRMAEDLTDYLIDVGVKTRYLHSDIDTIERAEIIRALRLGEFDVLVGINLLREGLDLPEVSLVAILDADKEGFLRSETGLIQTIGRAARNINGMAILYADTITDSVRSAVSETNRRRKLQKQYNEKHGITPKSTSREISRLHDGYIEQEQKTAPPKERLSVREIEKKINSLKGKMRIKAQKMDFEGAATIRDEISELRKLLLSVETGTLKD
ncbi:MAG: excinuclease ABC subunit UvrB [Myxococcales bacterium]|nr:excinuclease ABC subunit UvrB [Myxococcales bacterium]USN51948.1 MAG: excinuclease ABC subunit UvrB [Myxococcales bacterium]